MGEEGEITNMEKINIEQIMEEIRAEIKAKGFTNDMLSFDDIVDSNTKHKNIEDYYDILNNTWNIQAYRVLPGGSGLLGKIKVFMKKVLRKLIKFYIEPVVNEQNEFNANNVRLLNLISSYMELNDKKIEILESEIEHLRKQLADR